MRPTLNAVSQSIALLLIRIGSGIFMIYGHGWGKLMNFGDRFDRFADPVGLGSGLSLTLVVFAEVLCAGLITVGLFTRLAAAVLAIEMLILTFIVHIDDPFRSMEVPLLYFSAYAALLVAGAGWYSVDNILWRRKSSDPTPKTISPGKEPAGPEKSAADATAELAKRTDPGKQDG